MAHRVVASLLAHSTSNATHTMLFIKVINHTRHCPHPATVNFFLATFTHRTLFASSESISTKWLYIKLHLCTFDDVNDSMCTSLQLFTVLVSKQLLRCKVSVIQVNK